MKPTPTTDRRAAMAELSPEALRCAQQIFYDKRVYARNADLIRAHALLIQKAMNAVKKKETP
jgi:hypothetical protein